MSTGRLGKNMGLLLNGKQAVVTKYIKKANVLNAFFTLSLLVGPAFRNRRPLGAVTKSGTRKPSPWVDED